MIVRLVSPLVLTGSLSLMSATAGAGPPPPSWAHERVVECAEGPELAYPAPARFGAPFHVVGTNDVIIPKEVKVVLAPEAQAGRQAGQGAVTSAA